jgi:hypothetical protein
MEQRCFIVAPNTRWPTRLVVLDRLFFVCLFLRIFVFEIFEHGIGTLGKRNVQQLLAIRQAEPSCRRMVSPKG